MSHFDGPLDLVRRDFTAPAPGCKMVGDITYIPTWEGWVYLATVTDYRRPLATFATTISTVIALHFYATA